MLDYADTYALIRSSGALTWTDYLKERVAERLYRSPHGDLQSWLSILECLPDIRASSVDFDRSAVRIGTEADCDSSVREELESSLKRCMPWRKGPFELFGILIDTEWRSDLKWERLKSHISSLENRIVLDVGCGNGYYLYRMYAEGARLALGIDVTLLYTMQFWALSGYADTPHCAVFPLSLADLRGHTAFFDTVFSMGVIYHERSPLEHLDALARLVCPGGELVLETLVIDKGAGALLVPEKRYAKMRNVWSIPSVETCIEWCARAGFKNIRLVDVTRTTVFEQRPTPWMQFESLVDFLDPGDDTRTIEGYPAPTRAIFIMNK
jgi:tRNA (mo5U34)-methyltransferase